MKKFNQWTKKKKTSSYKISYKTPPPPPKKKDWLGAERVNLCTVGGIQGYQGAIFIYHQKSCLFALAYHDVLLLCTFFHFHVYRIEKHTVPFEKGGNLPFLHTDILNIFFLPIGCQSLGCAVKMERNYPPGGGGGEVKITNKLVLWWLTFNNSISISGTSFDIWPLRHHSFEIPDCRMGV